VAAYYQDKLESLADIFGASSVALRDGWLQVEGRTYPIVDDVIVVLDPAHHPPGLRERLVSLRGSSTAQSAHFSQATQQSFGAEWDAFPDVLDEHEAEFRQYFDLVDLGGLRNARAADLGCGSGRWSYFLESVTRELVLVDFSEAIFVARRNLRGCPGAIFVMADVTQLPFRKDFADLVVCLGVLHHLPIAALEMVRLLAPYAPRALIYLYYALDNRPAHYGVLLRAVTAARRLTCRVRSRRVRAGISWAGTAGLYVPLVALGSVFWRLGLGGLVPLHDAYGGKSFRRMRQDFYDRFFTSIEQRFSRRQIQELEDTFAEVRVSESLPYWHFVCLRADATSAPSDSQRSRGIPVAAGASGESSLP
jgi:SAM-dependent methyltransferase